MSMSSQFLEGDWKELQTPLESGVFDPRIVVIPVICFGTKQIEVNLKVTTIYKSLTNKFWITVIYMSKLALSLSLCLLFLYIRTYLLNVLIEASLVFILGSMDKFVKSTLHTSQIAATLTILSLTISPSWSW